MCEGAYRDACTITILEKFRRQKKSINNLMILTEATITEPLDIC